MEKAGGEHSQQRDQSVQRDRERNDWCSGRSRNSARLDIRVSEGGDGAWRLGGLHCGGLEGQAKEPSLSPGDHGESRKVSEVGTPWDTCPPGTAFVTVPLLSVSMRLWVASWPFSPNSTSWAKEVLKESKMRLHIK